MSKAKQVHLAYKQPNGIQVLISSELKTFLSKHKVKAEGLWRVGGNVGQCTWEGIDCRWPCVQIMGNMNIGREIHTVLDLSFIDPICICPEKDCRPAIRVFEPGVALLGNPAIYFSFEQLLRRMPLTQLKATQKLIQAIMAEK